MEVREVTVCLPGGRGFWRGQQLQRPSGRCVLSVSEAVTFLSLGGSPPSLMGQLDPHRVSSGAGVGAAKSNP